MYHKVELELEHGSVLPSLQEVGKEEEDLHGVLYLRPLKSLASLRWFSLLPNLLQDDSPNQ
eukprot:12337618-Ditylum_brightwellii.AAC.1